MTRSSDELLEQGLLARAKPESRFVEVELGARLVVAQRVFAGDVLKDFGGFSLVFRDLHRVPLQLIEIDRIP